MWRAVYEQGTQTEGIFYPIGGSTLRMSFVHLTDREPEMKDPAHSVK